MKNADKDGTFDFLSGEPFIVREHQLLAELCEERGPKASIGIYAIQLPSSAKQTGRAQTPFASDRKIRAAELLLDVVPRKQAMSTEHPWAYRLVQTSSIFGCLHTFKSCDIERNGIGNIRYHVSGSREYALMHYSELMKLAAKKNMTKIDGEAQNDFASRVMRNACPEDVQGDDSPKLIHGVVGPKEVIVIPMGYVIAEQVVPFASGEDGQKLTVEQIKTSQVVGLRMHFLDPKASLAHKGFVQMFEEHGEGLTETMKKEDRTFLF